MRTKTAIASACLCLLFVLGITNISFADSAEVVPKGVFMGDVEYSYYFKIDTRFDSDGNEEDVATDYNTSMNSNIFQSLKPLEAAFGMPSGSASLGDSIVHFDYDVDELELKFFYGATDRLTIGIKIPYFPCLQW